MSRNSKTDKNGRFTITFPGGDGDYIISIAAFGFAAKRFELKRTADEEVLIADARLQRSAVNVHEQEVDSLEEITDISARISGASRRAILVPWRHQLDGRNQQAAAFDQHGWFPLERGDRNFLVRLLGRVVRGSGLQFRRHYLRTIRRRLLGRDGGDS